MRKMGAGKGLSKAVQHKDKLVEFDKTRYVKYTNTVTRR